MDETGLFATLFDDVFDPGLFTEGVDLANELNFDTIFSGNALGVRADSIPEHLSNWG
jgi:BioD-like phosphotransacetylase family protein